jgi:hypothetical protein
MAAQAVVTLMIGIIDVSFVPVLVWSMVIAGLYQIARAKMRAGVKTVAQKMTVSAK